jgi:hypothetical protein
MSTFLEELAYIFFGPIWYGQLFFFAVGLVGVLAWTGVLRTFVTVGRPGNPAGLVLIWASVLILSVGVAAYRAVFPGPSRPLVGFMVPLALFLVVGAVGCWLCYTTRPPRLVIPGWVRERAE